MADQMRLVRDLDAADFQRTARGKPVSVVPNTYPKPVRSSISLQVDGLLR